jgi:hypothetical protein
MKSYLKTILILSILFLTVSCEEDEGKILQTDLSHEANQLFEISNAWGESLYFGLLSLEDYSQILINELPGCPSVVIEAAAKRVTLTFDPKNPCEQSGKVKRAGKIIIQYPLTNTASSIWTMTYQDYVFQKQLIQGIREFNYTSLNQVKEVFTNLKTTNDRQINTTFSGSLTHIITKLRLKLIGMSSTGAITGINPAGRSFMLEITSPRQALGTCFSQNQILPIAGKENWTINRGQGRDVIHSINYESAGSCAVTATVKLSDGRNLIVLP